jgi:hypothetical protein
MATAKVSLTLDSELLKEARTHVGRRGLSSYIDGALRLRLQHDRLRVLLAEMDAEHGQVPTRIKARVRAEWPDQPSGRSKKRRG